MTVANVTQPKAVLNTVNVFAVYTVLEIKERKSWPKESFVLPKIQFLSGVTFKGYIFSLKGGLFNHAI